MGALIATLRDDFVDNATAAAWDASTLGSATVAETSGEARFTLPSSGGVGPHIARYTSHSTYDLTAGSFYINIDTMVATGVAATAFFQLYLSGTNILQWIQVSGTLYARTIIAGVSTDRYSAAWNASTYKYLRIRESGGNILWDSSTNGTSWTNRATLATPFTITDLTVDFGTTCGNVASPGSFRLEDVNLILPALATNWRWQQAVWPFFERNKNTTIAIDAAGTAQGYLVTADGVDVNGDPSGNVRYWSGPADGGRVLTEQPSQAAAEAMAVDLPLDGRFDLATQIEARCYRLYDRSVDGSAYTIREFYPRRLVQADDIEAESIRALHIASASITGDRIVAGTITADLITVDELAALAIDTGSLDITGVISIGSAGGIYQGTGTFASPTTGLKLYNSGGVGRLAGYNATVEQVAIDTDGKLKAGAGVVVLDATGVTITSPTFTYNMTNLSPVIVPKVNAIEWTETTADQAASIAGSTDGQLLARGDRITLATPIPTTDINYGLDLRVNGANSIYCDTFGVRAPNAILDNALLVTADFTSETNNIVVINAALNVGTATGAVYGGIKATIADAGTTNTSPSLYLGHNTSGTPGVDFGADIVVTLDTTTTADTLASIIRTGWDTATHASRKGHVQHYVYDTGPRLALEIAASGSAPMAGFLGAAPVVRQVLGAAAPAGGVGTAAGGWSSAANRDAAITLLNAIRTALINNGLCSA